MHTINISDDGGVTADCRDVALTNTANGPYVGMPKGFIFGPIDRPYTIPQWQYGPINGSNNGLDAFIGARDINLSVAPYSSFDGFGQFSAKLTEKEIPSEVRELADILWHQEIM